jgi:alkanesulfonate monooxygenase SsuD/methylene tetrahydromethanopterin reductase-like flavin-dependent oxidoreductase (luciferase family)
MAEKLDFSIFAHGNNWSYEGTRAIWQEAERLGFGAAWTQDNIMGHSPYVPADIGYFEVFTLLSAIAQATSKIRIGPMATPVPRRIPPLLAKMVASIDNISNGRVNLAIGAGDDEFQYRAWGQDFPPAPQRVQMLRESIQIMKLMWTQERATFEGKHFRVEGTALSPKPVQKPHPPIWVAIGQGAKLMPKVAAELADGIGVEWGIDDVAGQITEGLKKNCDRLGRDVSEIARGRLVWIIFTDGSLEHDEAIDGLYDVVRGRHATRPSPPYTYFEVVDPVVYGTAEQVCEGLQRRVLDLDFNHVIAVPIAVGIEVDTGELSGSQGNFIGAMRYLAQKIMPEFN